MSKKIKNSVISPYSEHYFLWGLMLLLSSLVCSLGAYYLYSSSLRQFAFFWMLLGLGVLFWSMTKNLQETLKNRWLAFVLILVLIVIYFLQRMELPRYDFSVGDPSDYFLAGVCSVVYNQDIGFFMPLTATISALGYELFGVQYAPFMHIILFMGSIPISYFIFKKFALSTLVSFLMSVFLIFVPLNIWFSKTSFSEPLWQMLLLVFTINAYYLLSRKDLMWKNIIILYMLIFLAPFLRGEGVLYYGLLLFLVLYHYWKYTDFNAAMWLGVGTLALAGTIHLTLNVRSNYLLKMQFNRVIPHITEFQLISILYGAAAIAIIIMALLYLIRNSYKKIPLPLILVILSLCFKVTVAYIYATKKDMDFTQLLFLNEYGFAIGNFGMPITFMMMAGVVLLYLRAIKGEVLALIVIMIYTIFYLSFSMQAASFTDTHAMFLYWNRYYFSIFMMIHIFAFGVVVKTIYEYVKKYVSVYQYRVGIFLMGFFLLLFFSMDSRLYHIVVDESHQKGAYKFYEWVKKKVGKQPISLVMDSSIVYKQNKGHIGVNDIKYMVSRGLSIYKINVKSYQKVQPDKLKLGLKYDLNLSKVRYLLVIGDKDYHLESEKLTVVDRLILPLEWREHFGLDADAQKIHHGDVCQSVVKHLSFYSTLYRVEEKLIIGQEVSFHKESQLSTQMLKDGWSFISDNSNAFCREGKGTIILPKMKQQKGKQYRLKVKYAVINAREKEPKNIKFIVNNQIIKKQNITSHSTRETMILLSNDLLPLESRDIELKIETTDKAHLMLRSLTIFLDQ